MNRITLVALPSFLFLLGCAASVSSNLKSGNYSFLTPDVSVGHFGTNYIINAPLQVGKERVVAETFATDCENGYGTLNIKADKYEDRGSYNSVISGPEKTDALFSSLCSKGLPVARSMESKMTPEQMEDRKKAANAALTYMLNQPKSKPRAPSRIERLRERERMNDLYEQQQKNYSCTTTYNLGSAHTNCNRQ